MSMHMTQSWNLQAMFNGVCLIDHIDTERNLDTCFKYMYCGHSSINVTTSNLKNLFIFNVIVSCFP